MNRPMVDVIIPTVNRLQMLQEAIASIEAQTYQNWQLFVADNGSTDGTIEWLDSQSIPWVLETVRGVGSARNAGAAATHNPYIYFLDNDDLAEPNGLELMVDAITTAQVDFCYGIAQNVVITEGIQLHEPTRSRPAPIASSSLMSRAALGRFGYFELNNYSWASWYLKAKDAGLTEVTLDEQICRRRIHGGNISSEADAKSKFFELIRSRLAEKQGPNGEV